MFVREKAPNGGHRRAFECHGGHAEGYAEFCNSTLGAAAPAERAQRLETQSVATPSAAGASECLRLEPRSVLFIDRSHPNANASLLFMLRGFVGV